MTNQPNRRRMGARKSRQAGFGIFVAIVIMVMLATLAAAIMRLSTTQQTSFAQDVLGAKAFQAANAGTEWGMYQALKAGSCASSTDIDLTAETGFKVTVTCTTKSYNEGQTGTTDAVVNLYIIEAVACNGTAVSCPDNTYAANANYIERKRQSIVSQANNGF
jgi:MSHA biogenesis protein MshP